MAGHMRRRRLCHVRPVTRSGEPDQRISQRPAGISQNAAGGVKPAKLSPGPQFAKYRVYQRRRIRTN